MNSRRSVDKENKPFVVPATPNLKQLGYGTGKDSLIYFYINNEITNSHYKCFEWFKVLVYFTSTVHLEMVT